MPATWCSIPFLGSGTTMAAADVLDRVGYGCEISPAYCDVILRRIANLDRRGSGLARQWPGRSPQSPRSAAYRSSRWKTRVRATPAGSSTTGRRRSTGAAARLPELMKLLLAVLKLLTLAVVAVRAIQ